MSQIPALERIAFQHQSPLAKRIVDLSQVCIDGLAKTNPNRTETMFVPAGKTRINTATKYLNRHFVPGMQEILKDELNLRLAVHVEQYEVCMNAACFVEYKKFKKDEHQPFNIGIDMYSGVKLGSVQEYDKAFFEQQADSIDLDIGKLNRYSEDVIMHLWVFTTTFMCGEVFDPKYYTPNSAVEIAAVILHEIGHAMTFIEHCADMYYRTDVISNTVKYTNDLSNSKEILTVVDKLSEKSNNEVLAPPLAALKQARNIGIFTPIICLLELLIALPLSILVINERLITNSRYFSLNESSKKTSDVVATRNNSSYCERLADEFVSRHGLGAALISALERSRRFVEEGHAQDPAICRVKAFGVVQTILMSFQMLMNCFVFPLLTVDDHTYDPDWLRYEHILQDALVAFKDAELDEQTRTYFIEQVRQLEKLISDLKASKSYKIKQFIFGKLLGIFNRNSTIDAIATANLSADYDRLQLLTNGLIKNKLYYHAARLQNLMKAK